MDLLDQAAPRPPSYRERAASSDSGGTTPPTTGAGRSVAAGVAKRARHFRPGGHRAAASRRVETRATCSRWSNTMTADGRWNTASGSPSGSALGQRHALPARDRLVREIPDARRQREGRIADRRRVGAEGSARSASRGSVVVNSSADAPSKTTARSPRTSRVPPVDADERVAAVNPKALDRSPAGRRSAARGARLAATGVSVSAASSRLWIGARGGGLRWSSVRLFRAGTTKPPSFQGTEGSSAVPPWFGPHRSALGLTGSRLADALARDNGGLPSPPPSGAVGVAPRARSERGSRVHSPCRATPACTIPARCGGRATTTRPGRRRVELEPHPRRAPMARQGRQAPIQPGRNGSGTHAALTPPSEAHTPRSMEYRESIAVEADFTAFSVREGRLAPITCVACGCRSSVTPMAPGGTSRVAAIAMPEAVSWPAPSSRTRPEASPRPSAEAGVTRVPRTLAAGTARRAEPKGIGSACARDPLAREVKLVGALLGQGIVEQEGIGALPSSSSSSADPPSAAASESPAGSKAGRWSPRRRPPPSSWRWLVPSPPTSSWSIWPRRASGSNAASARERAGVLRWPRAIGEAIAALPTYDTRGRSAPFGAAAFSGPVLTAHPTEARRRTVLVAQRRLYRRLDRFDDPRLTRRGSRPPPPAARGDHRPVADTGSATHGLTPLDEVRAAMVLFDETLFRVTPQLYRAWTGAARPGAAPRPGLEPAAPVPALGLLDRWRPRRPPRRHGRGHPRHLRIQADHVLRGYRNVARRAAADPRSRRGSRSVRRSFADGRRPVAAPFPGWRADLDPRFPRQPTGRRSA